MEEDDWGFTNFYKVKELFHNTNPDFGPMVEDDTATLTTFVSVYKDPTGFLWRDFTEYVSLQ
jgi:hypothetical protein